MRIKQTLQRVSFGLMAGFVLLTGMPVVAHADCAGVQTSIIGGDICGGASKTPTTTQNNAIWSILQWVLKIMVAGVGVLAVAGIVYAAVLYTTAADSAEQVKKAKGLILNVAIGLIAFALMYTGLNFLIPGGVFG